MNILNYKFSGYILALTNISPLDIVATKIWMTVKYYVPSYSDPDHKACNSTYLQMESPQCPRDT